MSDYRRSITILIGVLLCNKGLMEASPEDRYSFVSEKDVAGDWERNLPYLREIFVII